MALDLSELLGALGIGLASSAAFALLLALGSWLGARLGQWTARHRWRFKEPSSIVIIVAESSATDTGIYKRPATGIGQVKALAMLAPSLARAYKEIDFQHVRFPSDCSGVDLEADLLLLGGPKNNDVVAAVLPRIGSTMRAWFDERDRLHVLHQGQSYMFESLVVDGTVKADIGLILSLGNPFAPKQYRRIVVVAGSHTFGTLAAARRLLEGKQGRHLFPVSLGRDNDYLEVVSADVRQNHVFEPRLLLHADITPS